MLIKREVLQAVVVATTKEDTRYFLNAVHILPDGLVEATDGHVLFRARGLGAPTDDADFPVVPGIGDEMQRTITEPILVSTEEVKRLIAGTPKRGTISVLTEVQVGQVARVIPATTLADGTEVEERTVQDPVLVATDLQVPVVVRPKTEGQFPVVDRVMLKDDEPVITVCVATEVLERVIKAAKAVYATERDPRVTFSIPTRPTKRRKLPTGPDEPAQYGPEIETQIGITIQSLDVRVDGVIMPIRNGG